MEFEAEAMIAKRKNTLSISSYNGWLNHCNGINLRKKLLNGNQRNKTI